MRALRFALSTAIILSVTTLPLTAATDSKTGGSGTSGSSGSDGNPGQIGGAGTPGLTVNADAGFTTPNTDTSNTATATGGNGGAGGNGGNGMGTDASGGNGGVGGTGGVASAQAGMNSPSGTGLTATGTATGGNGGNGGTGGSSTGSGSPGTAGNGGDGGGASANTLSTTANATIHSVATGGNGGQASGAGATAGNGGSATAIASGVAGDTIEAEQVGGNGGAGLNGANGGNGADSVMNNQAIPVVGTLGSLTFMQASSAGSGGSATGGGTAGSAGNSSSSVNFNLPTNTGDLNAVLSSHGGNGGNGNSGGTPSAGGAASISVNVVSGGNIDITANEQAGAGGSVNDSGIQSAAGGAASVDAEATTTGENKSVLIEINAFGGSVGRNNGTGSYAPAQNFQLINAADVNGPASSTLEIDQRAVAGSGGTAGDCLSSLTLNKNVKSLGANATSQGGVSRTGSHGGNATAFSSITNSGGTSTVFVAAEGANTLAGGSYGDSNGTAIATTTLPGAASTAQVIALPMFGVSLAPANSVSIATANSNAGLATAAAGSCGSSGSATSQSNFGGDGMLIAIKSNATSPLSATPQDDVANVRTTAGSVSDLSSIFSTGVLLTSPYDVQQAVAMACLPTGEGPPVLTGPNATAAFEGSGRLSTYLGITALAASHSNDILATGATNGISETQTASTEYTFDLSKLANRGELMVGLLGTSTLSNSGFQSLEFIIERGGSAIAGQDYTFTDLATAQAFFSDHVLDLGSITDGSSNNQLDLNFVMNLTTLNVGDSFAADLIFANVTVPEPAMLGVAMLAGALLCRSRRRC